LLSLTVWTGEKEACLRYTRGWKKKRVFDLRHLERKAKQRKEVVMFVVLPSDLLGEGKKGKRRTLNSCARERWRRREEKGYSP